MNCLKFVRLFTYSINNVLPGARSIQKNNILSCNPQPSAFKKLYLNNFCTAPDANSDEMIESMIQELSNGDPALINKIKVLMLEIEVMRQDGRKAPLLESIKKQHWEQLIMLPSSSSRHKYLDYLWTIDKKKENAKLKKQAATQKYLDYKQSLEGKEVEEDKENSPMEYGLLKNAMFLRIYESSLNKFYNHKLMQAMQFGQKLVIDCSYDQYMNAREATNAAKQLTLLFAENRNHIEPFDLNFCNCDLESVSMKQLYRNIPIIEEPWFPLQLHKKSFMELYPKEKLVYLTPHCRNEMTTFDHDAIYIIGAMVDKVNTEPLSLAKAKEHGLKMAKIPLERYLQWGSGSGKSLTLNQVTNILLDMKLTGSWEESLKHVPRRKIFQITNNERPSHSRKTFNATTSDTRPSYGGNSFKTSSSDNRSLYTRNNLKSTSDYDDDRLSQTSDNDYQNRGNMLTFKRRKQQYSKSTLSDNPTKF